MKRTRTLTDLNAKFQKRVQKLTKDYDERYWAFAVKVEELEE